MRKMLLSIAAWGFCICGALHAQDFTGTWQGTLHTPQKDYRFVFKIEKTGKGDWKTVEYTLDTNGLAAPATTTAIQGASIQCAFIFLNSSYQGTLAADGKSIAGAWTGLDRKAIPLILERATPETEWAIPDPPPPPKLMAPDAHPVFEASTIRPTKPGTDTHYGGWPLLKTTNTNLIFLMVWAYGLQARQIVGAPEWADKDAFDVTAKTSSTGNPSDEQHKEAIRALLEERFSLKYHYGEKEMPAYEIVVAKGGPNLTPSEEKTENHHYGLNPGSFNGYNFSIQDLGNILGRFVLDKPVINRTGLDGRYDMAMTWTSDEFELGQEGATPPSTSEQSNGAPGLFTAIQQQLGLKLQPTKGPVKVLIIDHVEKPSEN